MDVAQVLSDFPCRQSLIPPDPYSCTKPSWNVFHETRSRANVAAALAADFGETSDIFVTASEARGISIRDLRVKVRNQHSNIEDEEDTASLVAQQNWCLPRGVEKPSRSLRSVAFCPGYKNLLVLTDTFMYIIDRRLLKKPVWVRIAE